MAERVTRRGYWMPDESARTCIGCGQAFGWFVRRHHCRFCGRIFCNNCSSRRCDGTKYGLGTNDRICEQCFATELKLAMKQPDGRATVRSPVKQDAAAVQHAARKAAAAARVVPPTIEETPEEDDAPREAEPSKVADDLSPTRGSWKKPAEDEVRQLSRFEVEVSSQRVGRLRVDSLLASYGAARRDNVPGFAIDASSIETVPPPLFRPPTTIPQSHARDMLLQWAASRTVEATWRMVATSPRLGPSPYGEHWAVLLATLAWRAVATAAPHIKGGDRNDPRLLIHIKTVRSGPMGSLQAAWDQAGSLGMKPAFEALGLTHREGSGVSEVSTTEGGMAPPLLVTSAAPHRSYYDRRSNPFVGNARFGWPGACEVTRAVVFRKQLPLKRSYVELRNPRVLLLDDALTMKGGLSVREAGVLATELGSSTDPAAAPHDHADIGESIGVTRLESMIEQEKATRHMLTRKVTLLSPQLLLCSQDISRKALEELMDEGIIAVPLVKRSVLGRVSRALGCSIVPSAHYLDKLGRASIIGVARTFRAETVALARPGTAVVPPVQSTQVQIGGIAGSRPGDMSSGSTRAAIERSRARRLAQMPLMRIEALPGQQACTVLLRGCPTALKSAKAVLRTAVHVAYTALTEASCLLDMGLAPGHIAESVLSMSGKPEHRKELVPASAMRRRFLQSSATARQSSQEETHTPERSVRPQPVTASSLPVTGIVTAERKELPDGQWETEAFVPPPSESEESTQPPPAPAGLTERFLHPERVLVRVDSSPLSLAIPASVGAPDDVTDVPPLHISSSAPLTKSSTPSAAAAALELGRSASAAAEDRRGSLIVRSPSLSNPSHTISSSYRSFKLAPSVIAALEGAIGCLLPYVLFSPRVEVELLAQLPDTPRSKVQALALHRTRALLRMSNQVFPTIQTSLAHELEPMKQTLVDSLPNTALSSTAAVVEYTATQACESLMLLAPRERMNVLQGPFSAVMPLPFWLLGMSTSPDTDGWRESVELACRSLEHATLTPQLVSLLQSEATRSMKLVERAIPLLVLHAVTQGQGMRWPRRPDYKSRSVLNHRLQEALDAIAAGPSPVELSLSSSLLGWASLEQEHVTGADVDEETGGGDMHAQLSIPELPADVPGVAVFEPFETIAVAETAVRIAGTKASAPPSLIATPRWRVSRANGHGDLTVGEFLSKVAFRSQVHIPQSSESETPEDANAALPVSWGFDDMLEPGARIGGRTHTSFNCMEVVRCWWLGDTRVELRMQQLPTKISIEMYLPPAVPLPVLHAPAPARLFPGERKPARAVSTSASTTAAAAAVAAGTTANTTVTGAPSAAQLKQESLPPSERVVQALPKERVSDTEFVWFGTVPARQSSFGTVIMSRGAWQLSLSRFLEMLLTNSSLKPYQRTTNGQVIESASQVHHNFAFGHISAEFRVAKFPVMEVMNRRFMPRNRQWTQSERASLLSRLRKLSLEVFHGQLERHARCCVALGITPELGTRPPETSPTRRAVEPSQAGSNSSLEGDSSDSEILSPAAPGEMPGTQPTTTKDLRAEVVLNAQRVAESIRTVREFAVIEADAIELRSTRAHSNWRKSSIDSDPSDLDCDVLSCHTAATRWSNRALDAERSLGELEIQIDRILGTGEQRIVGFISYDKALLPSTVGGLPELRGASSRAMPNGQGGEVSEFAKGTRRHSSAVPRAAIEPEHGHLSSTGNPRSSISRALPTEWMSRLRQASTGGEDSPSTDDRRSSGPQDGEQHSTAVERPPPGLAEFERRTSAPKDSERRSSASDRPPLGPRDPDRRFSGTPEADRRSSGPSKDEDGSEGGVSDGEADDDTPMRNWRMYSSIKKPLPSARSAALSIPEGALLVPGHVATIQGLSPDLGLAAGVQGIVTPFETGIASTWIAHILANEMYWDALETAVEGLYGEGPGQRTSVAREEGGGASSPGEQEGVVESVEESSMPDVGVGGGRRRVATEPTLATPPGRLPPIHPPVSDAAVADTGSPAGGGPSDWRALDMEDDGVAKPLRFEDGQSPANDGTMPVWTPEQSPIHVARRRHMSYADGMDPARFLRGKFRPSQSTKDMMRLAATPGHPVSEAIFTAAEKTSQPGGSAREFVSALEQRRFLNHERLRTAKGRLSYTPAKARSDVPKPDSAPAISGVDSGGSLGVTDSVRETFDASHPLWTRGCFGRTLACTPEEILLSRNGQDILVHSSGAGSDGSVNMSIKVYWGTHFHALRQLCLGSQRSFIESLALSELWKTSGKCRRVLCGLLCVLRVDAGGKSGSRFERSKDRRFVVKIVGQNEFQNFINNAPSYFDHMREVLCGDVEFPADGSLESQGRVFRHRRPSFLVRILGAFEVSMSYNTKQPPTGHVVRGLFNRGKRSVEAHVLIMENLFYGAELPTRLVFDLKGKARNTTEDIEEMQQHLDRVAAPTAEETTEAKQTKGAVLLDSDFARVHNGQPLALTGE
jgi:hypothetical protein